MQEEDKNEIEEITAGMSCRDNSECCKFGFGGLRKARDRCLRGLSLTGFTLTEVVVVIAIVALSASILVPALNEARNGLRVVGCRAQLHQLGQIWMMYTDENDGLFPERGSGYSYGTVSWFHCIRDYYSADEDLILCPMATQTFPEGGRNPHMAWYNTTDFGAYYKGSYGINLWVSRSGSGSAAGPNFNRNCWKSPNVSGASNAPLLLCSQWKDIQPYPSDEPLPYETRLWTPGPLHEMRRPCIKRHPPYHVQVLFLDTSVDKRTIKQLWRLKWHRHWPPRDPLPIWPEWMADVPEPD